jgi:hypothetical protein
MICDEMSEYFGKDWRVVCGHCGLSIAGRRSFESELIVLRWTKSKAWLGRLEQVT